MVVKGEPAEKRKRNSESGRWIRDDNRGAHDQTTSARVAGEQEMIMGVHTIRLHQ